MGQITIEQAYKDGATVEWRGIRIESITLTRRKKAPYDVKGRDAHASYRIGAWPWMLVDVAAADVGAGDGSGRG